MREKFPWKQTSIKLKLFEQLLYMMAYTFLTLYMYFGFEIKFNGFAAFIPAALACAISTIFISYEETPCNATMQLTVKLLTVLRLMIAGSAFMKTSKKAQMDWSTTFWPYWCSFAIQAILGGASFVIFINTVINFLKK